MKKLFLFIAILLASHATPLLAQPAPIQWFTEGLKNSLAPGTPTCPPPPATLLTGTCLPAGTEMASTGLDLSTRAAGWAFIPQCTGVPIVDGGIQKGGAGAYVLERYTASGSTVIGLIAHVPMFSGGLQSIPPVLLGSGEGLRIRTLAPLQGILLCSIPIYVF